MTNGPYPKIFEPDFLAPAFRQGGAIPCEVLSIRCDVDITISRVPTASGFYCLAQLPEELTVHGRGLGGKMIVWTLKPDSSTAGATFEFQHKRGILLIDDPKGQLLNGGIGESASAPDPMKYHFWNRRSKANTATYLPIILQTVNGVVSLCAAADPKIVNS